MTDIEYRLLFELSVNAGRPMNHTELLQRVGWKTHRDVRVMRPTVSRLCRKLGDDSNYSTYIFNEPRFGYRMEEAETRGSEAS